MVDLPTLYMRLRTGKVFLILITLFCGGWAFWNLTPGLPHFDDGALGRLTTILSIEASIAASMILAHNERTEAAQRRQDERHERLLGYILHLLESQQVMLRALRGGEVATEVALPPGPSMEPGDG